MTTQPPWIYTEGAKAGRPVEKLNADGDQQSSDWAKFCDQNDANRALKYVQGIDPNATMTKTNGLGGSYAPSTTLLNPSEIDIYEIHGTDPKSGLEIDELAGPIIDRMTNPQDGLDPSFKSITNFTDGTKSKLGNVELVYSVDDQGCVWALA